MLLVPVSSSLGPHLIEATAVVDRYIWVMTHHVLLAPHLKHTLPWHLLPGRYRSKCEDVTTQEAVLIWWWEEARGMLQSPTFWEDDFGEVSSIILQSPRGPNLHCTQQWPHWCTSLWLFLLPISLPLLAPSLLLSGIISQIKDLDPRPCPRLWF